MELGFDAYSIFYQLPVTRIHNAISLEVLVFAVLINFTVCF